MFPNVPRATLLTWLLGLVVFLVALGLRGYYLHEYQFIDSGPNQVWQVQGRGLVVMPPNTTELDQLVANCRKDGLLLGYQCRAPLGPDKDEIAAHRMPGYIFLRVGIEEASTMVNEYFAITPAASVRYVQVLLGAFTCLLYYMIAWRAFGQNLLVALLAGLGTACYPLWIISVGELEDGVLTSFLLAWSLYLSISIGHRGGSGRSLLLGLVLAAMSLTRAALLPLAVVIQLWFFLRSRRVSGGGMCSVLLLLGFAGGLAPWVFHCYQLHKAPVPVTSAAWLHVWIGNNEASDGGDYQWSMKRALDPKLARDPSMIRDPQLLTHLQETPQVDRYALLAEPVLREIVEKPWEACKHRLKAFLQFTIGTNALSGSFFGAGEVTATPPAWLKPVLVASLMTILGLAVLGWRWSYGWKGRSAPLSLAVFWLPLPYLLSHAGQWHASRLPLDGVIITLATIGLLGMLPGFGSTILAGDLQE